MKKKIVKVLFVASLLVGNATVSNAQSTLGNILSGVASAVTGNSTSSSSSSSSTTSSILSGLSSIFSSSKVATADQLAGTWTYQEPAVVFESSNVLKQAGGKLVSSKIEKKLTTVLTKYGITKGNMKMTFDSDGNFTQTIGKKTVKGTYTIESKQVKLTYTGGVKQILGTTQVDGSSLLIVMDASKLLKFAGAASSYTNNSVLKTFGSLISSMDGMQVGIRLKKTK